MFGIGDKPDRVNPEVKIEVAEVVMPGNPEGYIPDEPAKDASVEGGEEMATEKPETTLESMGGAAMRPPVSGESVPSSSKSEVDDLPSVPEVAEAAGMTDGLDEAAESDGSSITSENVEEVLFGEPAVDTDRFLEENAPGLEEMERRVKDIPELAENDDPNAVVLEWNPDLAMMPAGKFMEVVKDFVELDSQSKELAETISKIQVAIDDLEKNHKAIDLTMTGDLSRLMHELSSSLDRNHIRGDYGANDVDSLKNAQAAYASALAGQIGELGRFRSDFDKKKEDTSKQQKAWADKWGYWKEGDDAPVETKNDPA